MNARDCRAARLEIDSSELGQRLSPLVETHVAACPACATFKAERGQLRELVGSLKPVTAPPDFDLRLRARIARERAKPTRQPFIFRFAMTTPGIAAAATLVLVVAVTVWINQKDRTAHNTEVASVSKDAPAVGTNTASNAIKDEKSDLASDPVVAVTLPVGPKRSGSAAGNPARSAAPVSAPQVLEFNARGAQSLRQRADRDGEVSLSAPSQPMVVSVQDADGATHKILLPPISFGSQRLDNRTPVNMTSRKDW